MSEDEQSGSPAEKKARRTTSRPNDAKAPVVEDGLSQPATEGGSEFLSSEPLASPPGQNPADDLQSQIDAPTTPKYADLDPLTPTAVSSGFETRSPEPTGETASDTWPPSSADGFASAGRTEEPRSNAVTAIFGIILLLLLAGVGYLFYAQQSSSDVASTVGDVSKRLAAIEGRPVPAPVDIGPLATRLDGATKDIDSLKQALASLQSKVTADQGSNGAGDSAVAPAAEADVKALDAKVAGIDQAIGEIRTAVANVPKTDLGPLEGKIGEADQRLGALQKTVDGIPRIDLAPVTARLDAVEGRLKPIETQLEAAAAPAKVAQTRAAPLAVTADAIHRAIDAGRPFPADVEALRQLGADPSLIDPLQALAANGAPTLTDLRGDLAGLRDSMLVGSIPTPSGSYVDRLLAGAKTLVRVRPLGSVVGDSPGAIVARIDADLGNDDLAAALAEWQKLPEAARTVSKGLADRMRLRLAAETAARTIGSNAIQAMTAAKR